MWHILFEFRKHHSNLSVYLRSFQIARRLAVLSVVSLLTNACGPMIYDMDRQSGTPPKIPAKVAAKLLGGTLQGSYICSDAVRVEIKFSKLLSLSNHKLHLTGQVQSYRSDASLVDNSVGGYFDLDTGTLYLQSTGTTSGTGLYKTHVNPAYALTLFLGRDLVGKGWAGNVADSRFGDCYEAEFMAQDGKKTNDLPANLLSAQDAFQFATESDFKKVMPAHFYFLNLAARQGHVEAREFMALVKQAQQGDASAQYGLAQEYRKRRMGWTGSGSDRTDFVVYWNKKAAEQNSVAAQKYLGDAYFLGGSPETAANFYRKAALQGDSEAQYKLGSYYTNSVTPNFAQALEWYRKAADQGHVRAQEAVGYFYANGRAVRRDNVQALAWYRKAADQGSADAQVLIGEMYMRGQGVDKDYGQALSLFQTAANQGQPDAMLRVGEMYLRGLGVRPDVEEAANWYSKTRANDEAKAKIREELKFLKIRALNARTFVRNQLIAVNTQVNYCVHEHETLGDRLAQGYRAVEAKIYKTAVEIFHPLAEQGNATAQCFMAVLSFNGYGVPKDDGQAVAWFRKAADAGNTVSASHLGGFYVSGQAVPQDFVQAAALFCRAAQSGDAETQNKCGILYEYGEGVPKDYAKAAALYRKAADQGIADAQYNLGSLYYSGYGLPRDFAQAAAWYQKAANQSMAAAQLSLGIMTLQGQGVSADIKEAERLVRLAASGGNSWAQTAVENLNRKRIGLFGALQFIGNVFGGPNDPESAYAQQSNVNDERRRLKNEQWDYVLNDFGVTELNSEPCAFLHCIAFSLAER